MNAAQQNEPIGGLWAFVNNKVFILELKGQYQKMDHVKWFRHLGLPDFGPGFDAILRGRMVWDWHFKLLETQLYRQRTAQPRLQRTNQPLQQTGCPRHGKANQLLLVLSYVNCCYFVRNTKLKMLTTF